MAWKTSWDNAATSADEEIIKEAKDRFKICQNWESIARIRWDYDYKFANGDTHNKYQWDKDIVDGRELMDRPCLTINKTAQHNLLIINDAKQNKAAVRIRPTNDNASFEGAQIYQEIVYHIEYMSNAQAVYDHGTTWQVEAGIGYWRILVEWAKAKTFDQDIRIARIKDPRSVYMDPDINEVDGLDARFGFIFDDVPKDLFKDKYKEFADIVGFAPLGNDSADMWITQNHVRVAEYYRKTEKKDTYVAFIIPETGEQIESLLSELEDDKKDLFKEIKKREGNIDPELRTYRERKVLTDNIEFYKIAGNKIIERGPWLGKYIPIVRLPGTETVIDGIWDCKGHTRALINAQQIYNYNCLDLDTKLPTPTGWTTIREVKEGDYLLDDKGLPTKVLGISPININRKCFAITFDSGEVILADETHLWTVEERGKAIAGGWQWLNKTITTKELISKKHFIHVVKPVSLPETKLAIDPYVLGVWLGDGSTDCNRFTCDVLDAADMVANLSNKGYEIGRVRKNIGKSAVDITIHGLRNDLIMNKLLGNKHIPNMYLRASEQQRLALLQGLMDTDGCINKLNNQCIFTNSNQSLIANVIELISSLGIKCKKEIISARARKFPNGETYNCQEAYRLTFSADPSQPVFKLSRKLNIQQKERTLHWRRTKRHGIKSVVEIPSIPVKCLTVDSPSKLFLAGEHWIPTHNTSANVEYGALQTKSPWLAATQAIENFEEYYKTSNSKNHSYMPWNAFDEDGNPLPAPTRPTAPQPSPAYVQQLQIAQNEMMMVSGQYQAQMGEQENAKSGVAINARQRQGDRATYHFIDNQAIAIRATGKMLIDLIPKIYDTKRIKRMETSDGRIINLTIDPDAPQEIQNVTNTDNMQYDKQRQIEELIFNPTIGEYDIQADTGPSFATRRQEAFNALTQIAAQNKDFMNIAGDILWKVADFPEAQVLADRWRKIIPPNLTGDAPNPKITQAMQAAADQIQQQLAVIAKQAKELADKDKELTIKAQDLDLRFKTEKAEQARLDYDMETKRLVALGNSGPAISPETIKPIVEQLLRGMMKSGEPDENSKVDAESFDTGLNQDSIPGLPGSRQAPDGNHYAPDPNRPGKYLKAEPNAQSAIS